MIRSKLIASSALGLVLLSQIGTVARAQDVKLEEITVTARKVEENLMVVPIAISSLSNEALQQRGLQTTTELSAFTPGFFQQDTTASSTGRTDRSNQTLVFRALNVANNSGLTSGGSLFIDGAPVISLTAAGFADIERVEVLRGPQSVYFGRSTFGGAVNYVTKDPSLDEFHGHVSAQVGNYGSTEDTISLEGPIVADKFAVRITGYHTVRGGEWTNAGNPSEKLGAQSTDSVSASFLAKPSDNLKIKGYFNAYRDLDGSPAEASYLPSESNCTTVAGPYFCGKLAVPAAKNISSYDILNPYIQKNLFNNTFPLLFNPTSFNDQFGLKRIAYQSDLIINYETPSGYGFNSITAYHRAEYQAVDNLDYRDDSSIPNPLYGTGANVQPFDNWTSLVQSKLHDFSQEFRVTSPQTEKLRWVAGASYLNAYSNQAVAGVASQLGPLDFNPPQPNTVNTLGLFGGVYYDLTSDLTLSGEARYQWDKIKAVFGTQQLQNTFKSFSPRVTLDYKLNPDSSVYALYSRGVRPGGFNSSLLQAGASELQQILTQSGGGLSYQQEKLDNFEVGFKDRFLDNHASIRAAAYYGALTNEQVTSRVQVDVGLPTYNIYNVILNVGKANIFGFEFEGDYQVTNHLLLSGTFDWSGSSIRKYNCLDCATYFSGSTNVTGKKFNDVPEFSGTLSAEYTDHLTGDYDWFGRADYIYVGTQYADLNNVASTGASNRINLRVGARTKSLSVEAYVDNLTNDLTLTGLYPNVSTLTLANTQMRIGLPDKRTFGLRASYNF